MNARPYEVAPLRKVSIATLAVILALLPIGVLFVFTTGRAEPEALHIAQAVFLSLLPIALLIPALRRREVTFDGTTLTVKAGFHTRRREISELDVAGARVIDLDDETAYRPILRMFGFSLIGFHAGHYLLRNRKRAFALLTRLGRVLVLPERNGTLILLSLERPQHLLDDMRVATR
jgi:hypothetical protein